MTGISKPRGPYQNQTMNANGVSFGAKQICFIVGLVCVAGFIVDMLAIGMPPNPFDLPWRIGFLQQMGDRSIVLLFGTALLLYSQLGNRRLTRPLSLILLSIGVAFVLSSVLVIRDSLILRDQTINNISTQEQQIQTQIEDSRGNSALPPGVTPEQLDQAAQQITTQAEQLKQNTRNGITKSGLASIGNLIVVGMGLIGLGRFGLTSARKAQRN
ncbi:MAG: hypothetical protein DCF25_05640 [Leptolyngbya foveolarum]|uniref:Uncharacterized protein n=1 Tax=Leptolyngbya foveolarum TaxID=47253 RepID=A0A2W4WP76_9CYAN|nr:MAG: hypothetical protein DCF25_05640 [Leptolyngbya foveolarum]